MGSIPPFLLTKSCFASALVPLAGRVALERRIERHLSALRVVANWECGVHELGEVRRLVVFVAQLCLRDLTLRDAVCTGARARAVRTPVLRWLR